jgi:hypothetical protein
MAKCNCSLVVEFKKYTSGGGKYVPLLNNQQLTKSMSAYGQALKGVNAESKFSFHISYLILCKTFHETV